jgi:hypothetical protein
MGIVQYTVEDAIGLAAGAGNLQSTLPGYRDAANPYFSYHACTPWMVAADYNGSPPLVHAIPVSIIDWTLWDGVTNIVDFLNAQDETAGWYGVAYSAGVPSYAARAGNPAGGTYGYWLCEVAQWMLPYVSGRALTGTVRHTTPPIWPGVDNVTLGTPVNIDDTFSSAEPCNGVIVAITSWPTRYKTYDWGSVEQNPRAGYIGFLTPEGHQEDIRAFTWPDEIVVPRYMYDALGFVGRSRAGVAGTVTPWLIV